MWISGSSFLATLDAIGGWWLDICCCKIVKSENEGVLIVMPSS